MIRLDELGQRRDSSSHNSSAYKRGQADGSSVSSINWANTCVRSQCLKTHFRAINRTLMNFEFDLKRTHSLYCIQRTENNAVNIS